MIPNIFLWIRETNNLTQVETSRRVNLTAQTIGNYEAGLISYPPDSVVASYLELWKEVAAVGRGATTLVANYPVVFSPSGVRDAYNKFVHQKRIRSGGYLLSPNGRIRDSYTGLDHPFVQWRSLAVGSRKRFCNLFCVPYATLEKYETSGYLLPDWLRSVLLTAGVGADELDRLNSAIKEWYVRRNG